MPANSNISSNPSSYPPLLPTDSPETSSQPYYPANSPPSWHVDDNGFSDDDIVDEEDLLDGVPHVAFNEDEDDEDDDDAPADTDNISESPEEEPSPLLRSFQPTQLAPSELGEGRRGAARGRGAARQGAGRGRGRGSLKALLEFDARKRGEFIPTRSKGRPRGSRSVPRGEGQRGGYKGIRRGPRHTAEPTEQFKNLQSLATNAFLAGDYEIALGHAINAVQTNPEIFAAHNLLSEIYREMGKTEESLMVLWSGAHTKREPGVWWEVATRTSELSSSDEWTRDDNLLYCYSRIAIIDNSDLDARKGRLGIYMKRQSFGNAVRECLAMLKSQPYDLQVLQILAEISIPAGEIPKAIQAYDRAIQHFQLVDSSASSTPPFSFSDLNIFLELFAQSQDYAGGLVKLKSVARWLCGRHLETFWDSYQTDDREWDIPDRPRRITVPEFKSGKRSIYAYGAGLPVEIRAKMGLFRLRLGPTDFDEAMHHFNIIRFGDESGSSQDSLSHYQDLLREIADALFLCERYTEALQIYESLAQAYPTLDVELRFNMARSYKQLKKNSLALCLYESLLEDDPENPDYLVALAKIYEENNDTDKAMEYVSKVLNLGKKDKPRRLNNDEEGLDSTATASRKPKGRTITSTMKRALPDLELYDAYNRLQELGPLMRAEDEVATAEWMEIAEMLMDDFKSLAIFFPADKWVRFLGYDPESRRRAFATRQGQPYTEAEIMADRLLGTGNAEQISSAPKPDTPEAPASIPQEYRNIQFGEWLDIFCEYAFCAARTGQESNCYSTIETAARANVFCHDKARLLHIHVCWFACAIILDDEDSMCQVSRRIIKTYPTATDGYRLFAALLRLYKGELNWYHSGPLQKFVMRQIKMIDLAILGESDEQSKRFEFEGHDRRLADAAIASSSQARTREQSPDVENNEPSGIVSHDPALLTLYGHMLATNGSYRNALNYYFRAYAVDPDNAMVVLSIAVAYLQLAMKRQTLNRHYNILQAVSLLDEYRKLRLATIETGKYQETDDSSEMPKERLLELKHNREMEVHFNEARLWHTLGLNHLAVAAYSRCLEMPGPERTMGKTNGEDVIMEEVEAPDSEPDFKREAAFALQQIYATAGDIEKAREITQGWLVF